VSDADDALGCKLEFFARSGAHRSLLVGAVLQPLVGSELTPPSSLTAPSSWSAPRLTPLRPPDLPLLPSSKPPFPSRSPPIVLPSHSLQPQSRLSSPTPPRPHSPEPPLINHVLHHLPLHQHPSLSTPVAQTQALHHRLPVSVLPFFFPQARLLTFPLFTSPGRLALVTTTQLGRVVECSAKAGRGWAGALTWANNDFATCAPTSRAAR
jgi:hypothetical protein